MVVAVTSNEPKSVSSGEGMERSRLTSPYYNVWVRDATTDFASASEAIENRDFPKLADVAEFNCLKMHSAMLTSQPALSYWTPASIACMDRIRSLREEGHDVFFTVDAGPQIKAVCLPASAAPLPARWRNARGGRGATQLSWRRCSSHHMTYASAPGKIVFGVNTPY